MAETRDLPRDHGGTPLFIDGYFSKRIWNGELPNYGYPKNHLPEVGENSMEVVTGFLTTADSAKI